MEIRSKALPPSEFRSDPEKHEFDLNVAHQMVKDKAHAVLHDYMLDAAYQKYPKDEQLAEHHVNLFMRLVSFQHDATVNPPETRPIKGHEIVPGMIVRPAKWKTGASFIHDTKPYNGTLTIFKYTHGDDHMSSARVLRNDDYTLLHDTSEQSNG